MQELDMMVAMIHEKESIRATFFCGFRGVLKARLQMAELMVERNIDAMNSAKVATARLAFTTYAHGWSEFVYVLSALLRMIDELPESGAGYTFGETLRGMRDSLLQMAEKTQDTMLAKAAQALSAEMHFYAMTQTALFEHH